MTIPFRLLVLQNLTKVIERVSVATGNSVDLAGAVFRGRALYGDNDPLPMVSILEPPIPLEAILGRSTNPGSAGDWELLIQGFVDDDPQHPSDPAHRLMADVKAELVKEKRRDRGKDILGLGNNRGRPNSVVEMMIGQGAVRPGDEVSAKTFFWLTLTLKLVENLEDPFEEG